MSLVLADRVLETCTSPGTGAVTLLGAATGYQTFSAGIGNGNTCYYCIADQGGANWEVGIGTYSSSGNTLTRTTPISGSAATPVNFSSGTQNVFVTYPAEKSVNLDSSGKLRANSNNYLDFASASPSKIAGRMWYNDTDGTWNLVMGGGNITQQVGEELFIYGKASNAISGDSLLQLIFKTGTVGGSGVLQFAPTTSGITDANLILGLGTEDISAGNFGRITTYGTIHGVNTSGSTYSETWVSGDVLWYDPATGGLTKTQPSAPNMKYQVGTVLTADATAGSFFVDLQSGSTLGGTDSNVQFGTLATNDLIQYNGTYWTNVAIGSGSGIQPYSAYTAFTNVTNTFSTDQIIVANTSTDALRITQTGTGNALLVEDAANPDSTPFVVDASGSVIRGYTANIFSTGIQSVSTSPGASSIAIGSFSATTLGAPLRLYHSRSGVLPDNTILNSGDELGKIEYYGADGASYIQGASITASVDSTPGTNDMPGRLVFSTTADGASSPTERMRIDNAGRVGIGSTSLTGYGLRVGLSITGATSAYGVFETGQIQSDVTSVASYFRTSNSSAATAFTTGWVRSFESTQGTIGAGSTITNQAGFFADASLTGATNNYGFYGNIASGTGRYNFYAAGTADNYFAGNVGIGSTSLTQFGLRIGKSITGNASSYNVRADGAIQSDVTTQAFYFNSTASTAAASFTLSQLRHFSAAQGTFGAGSTVSSQYGFIADSTLTGATANYGFYGNIASGANRYNFYAAGTADNYFAGSVGIGSTPATGYKVDVSSSGDTILRLKASGQANGLEVGQLTADGGNKIFAANNNYLAIGTNNTERMRITSNGGVSFGSSGTAYGTSGQVLQSNGDAPPTWVSASSAMTLVSTQTASNSAQIDWTGLDSTYTYFVLYTNVFTQYDSKWLGVRIGFGAGPTYVTSNYKRSYIAPSGSYTTFSASSSDTQFTLGSQFYTAATNEPGAGNFYVSQSTTSSRVNLHGVTNGSYTVTPVGGYCLNSGSAAFTAIRILTDGGYIASGTFSLYRINRA